MRTAALVLSVFVGFFLVCMVAYVNNLLPNFDYTFGHPSPYPKDGGSPIVPGLIVLALILIPWYRRRRNREFKKIAEAVKD